MCDCVEQALPGPVKIFEFQWSGRNVASRRVAAANRLRARLESLASQYEDEPIYVIAHSHGGNVALMAIGEHELERRVRLVICLSTPFITVRYRDKARLGSAQAVLGAALWLWVALWGSGITTIQNASLASVAVLVVLCGLLPTAEWLAVATRKRIALPSVGEVQLRILRSPADEASLALTISQVVSFAAATIWTVVRQTAYEDQEWDMPSARPTVRRPTPLTIGNILNGLGPIIGFVLGNLERFVDWATTITDDRQFRKDVALRLVWAAISGGAFTVALLVGAPLAVFALIILALPTWQIVIAVAATPLLPVLSVPHFLFSPGLVFFATFLQLSVESAPPGRWIVRQLDVPSDYAGSLFHSMTHSHHAALEQVYQWLVETVDSPRITQAVFPRQRIVIE